MPPLARRLATSCHRGHSARWVCRLNGLAIAPVPPCVRAASVFHPRWAAAHTSRLRTHHCARSTSSLMQAGGAVPWLLGRTGLQPTQASIRGGLAILRPCPPRRPPLPAPRCASSHFPPRQRHIHLFRPGDSCANAALAIHAATASRSCCLCGAPIGGCRRHVTSRGDTAGGGAPARMRLDACTTPTARAAVACGPFLAVPGAKSGSG